MRVPSSYPTVDPRCWQRGISREAKLRDTVLYGCLTTPFQALVATRPQVGDWENLRRTSSSAMLIDVSGDLQLNIIRVTLRTEVVESSEEKIHSLE